MPIRIDVLNLNVRIQSEAMKAKVLWSKIAQRRAHAGSPRPLLIAIAVHLQLIAEWKAGLPFEEWIVDGALLPSSRARAGE